MRFWPTCGVNSTSNSPDRYCRSNSAFSPTYEEIILLICLVWSSRPKPKLSTLINKNTELQKLLCGLVTPQSTEQMTKQWRVYNGMEQNGGEKSHVQMQQKGCKIHLNLILLDHLLRWSNKTEVFRLTYAQHILIHLQWRKRVSFILLNRDCAQFRNYVAKVISSQIQRGVFQICDRPNPIIQSSRVPSKAISKVL